jgi:hypothetical protein
LQLEQAIVMIHIPISISLALYLVVLATAQASILQAECDHIEGTKLGQYFLPGFPPRPVAGPDAMTDYKLIFTFDDARPSDLQIETSLSGRKSARSRTLPVVLRRDWIIIANELVGASDGSTAQDADFWSYALYPERNAGIFIRHFAGDSSKATRGQAGKEIAGEILQATCRFTPR